jgi:nucleoside-diphosphate-sugar epimerase
MSELAELFTKQAGYSPAFDYKTDAPAGVSYRVCDPTRMLDFYEPKVSLEEGVRRALETV